MGLHDSAMLVKLTVRKWDGFAKDKRVSKHVDHIFKTAGNVGNYNKRIIDKAILDPANQICHSLYSEHTRLTIPWCYDGVGLLPSKLFMEYTKLMRDGAHRLEQAVDNLAQQMPIYKANQAARLGDLYDPEDYPDSKELREKYEITYKFFPVPQEGHFIVNMEAEHHERLKQELRDTLAKTEKSALHTLYDRVLTMTEHVVERLSDPKHIFRESLVENLYQLAQNLPKLNVFDDHVLTEIAKDLNDKVLIATADELRTNLTVRAQVAAAAEEISQRLRDRM